MKIEEIILVEGKYDKIKLESIVDAFIIPCDGFSIFKQKDKINLIRELAEQRGLIILTDSDSGGFKIRSYVKGCIDNQYIKNAYVPDIFGKEKRKTKAGKEGKIGVEGISREIIIQALMDAGANERTECRHHQITSVDLYELGLFGKDHSKERRKELQAFLSLPSRLSKNELLQVLNIRFTKDEFIKIIKGLTHK